MKINLCEVVKSIRPLQTDTEGLLKIGISDEWVGIIDEDIPRLFDAFDRLGAEDSGNEGSVIGLPISRKIIEKWYTHDFYFFAFLYYK